MDDRTTDELARADRLLVAQLAASDAGSATGGRHHAGTGATGSSDATAASSSTDSSLADALDAAQTSCEAVDSPISAVPRGVVADGVRYMFLSNEYETEWSWYVDGQPIDEDRGRQAEHTFESPGKYAVSLERSVSNGPRGGTVDEVSRTVCVEPLVTGHELTEDSPAFLDYLVANGLPEVSGHTRWFTVRNSFLDGATVRWSVTAQDGGRDTGARAIDETGPTTAVRFYRPGRFTVTAEVETADGVTSSWSDSAEVTVDPEIQVVDRVEQSGGGADVEVLAVHPFLPTELETRWYLDGQEGEPVDRGPRAELSVSSVNVAVRVEVERPDGEVAEARAPLVGDLPSRWQNGATIHTSIDTGVVLEEASNEVKGVKPPAEAGGYRCDDVLAVEGPQVVRFTTGEESRPAWVTDPGYTDLDYRWSVKFSDRYRHGYGQNQLTPTDPSDLIPEYDWDDDSYEPRSTELLYPFTEPGWYVVELEQTSGDLQEEDGLGDSPAHDYVRVYVAGLEDPSAPWPEPPDYTE